MSGSHPPGRQHELHDLRYALTGGRRIPEDTRLFVWIRDGGRCCHCGAAENLEFDHVIPVSKGGSSRAANVELLCTDCNRRKGTVANLKKRARRFLDANN